MYIYSPHVSGPTFSVCTTARRVPTSAHRASAGPHTARLTTVLTKVFRDGDCGNQTFQVLRGGRGNILDIALKNYIAKYHFEGPSPPELCLQTLAPRVPLLRGTPVRVSLAAGTRAGAPPAGTFPAAGTPFAAIPAGAPHVLGKSRTNVCGDLRSRAPPTLL